MTLEKFGSPEFFFQIRPENPDDIPEIRQVLEAAFGQPQEASLVEALRQRRAVTLSLVAVHENRIIGHLLFSPVTIKSPSGSLPAVGLGPVAVMPSCQKRGVGAALIRSGLTRCQQDGHRLAVVLGHPDYYTRFGFAPAANFGLTCEFDVPPELFMTLELRPTALMGTSGVVLYPPEFHAV